MVAGRGLRINDQQLRDATLTATTRTPTVIEGLPIMVGYFFITTALGLFLFEHEEFTQVSIRHRKLPFDFRLLSHSG